MKCSIEDEDEDEGEDEDEDEDDLWCSKQMRSGSGSRQHNGQYCRFDLTKLLANANAETKQNKTDAIVFHTFLIELYDDLTHF